MAVNSSVLQSARYEIVNGVRMILYSPSEAIALLGVTKPTFYKWVRAGIIQQLRPPWLPKNTKKYFVTDANIKEVKAKMKAGWSQGKSLLKAKGGKR